MRKIAIEEHFSPKNERVISLPSDQMRRYEDLGEIRLEVMDEAGIDIQVISNGAPKSTAIAKRANDQLYEATKKYPERFVGLASLCMNDINESVKELERTIKDLDFRGVKIDVNLSREYYDKQKYWVIFEKAVELGVPIYLHPGPPVDDVFKLLQDYPVLLGPPWGYGLVAGLQAMRLICSAVFDEYPELKVILGHLGEAIPFWIWRIDNKWRELRREDDVAYNKLKLNKKPSQYLKDNFYVTPSGFFDKTAFMCTYEKLGADRILFAVDYPHESSKKAVQFIDALPIPKDDREKIYYLNAEKIFSI